MIDFLIIDPTFCFCFCLNLESNLRSVESKEISPNLIIDRFGEISLKKDEKNFFNFYLYNIIFWTFFQ